MFPMEIFKIQFSLSSTIKLSNKKTKTYVVNHYIIIIGTHLSMEISFNFLNNTHLWFPKNPKQPHNHLNDQTIHIFLDCY